MTLITADITAVIDARAPSIKIFWTLHCRLVLCISENTLVLTTI